MDATAPGVWRSQVTHILQSTLNSGRHSESCQDLEGLGLEYRQARSAGEEAMNVLPLMLAWQYCTIWEKNGHIHRLS